MYDKEEAAALEFIFHAVIFGLTEKEKGNDAWIEDLKQIIEKEIEDGEQRRIETSSQNLE